MSACIPEYAESLPTRGRGETDLEMRLRRGVPQDGAQPIVRREAAFYFRTDWQDKFPLG